jgi:peroxiredoxin Q/BCP
VPSLDSRARKRSSGYLFFVSLKHHVLFFYPKDDTPGCTKEACAFREEYEQFSELDTEVIGISSDSVDSHKSFAKKHNLSFTLLSDKEKRSEGSMMFPTPWV